MSPVKKVVAIAVLVLISLYIALPRELSINLSPLGVNFNRSFNLPGINLSIGNLKIQKNFDIVLGLDLAGGSHLVFETDTSGLDEDRKLEAIQGVRDVIERRVNMFGVSEPNVQTSSFEGKDRVIVELPGINDPAQAVSLIGQTAKLSFVELANPDDESNSDDEAPTFVPTDLGGSDLKRADVVFDRTTGKPAVSITFTEEGAKKFESLTEKNVGKALPIFLDSEIISAPVVQEKISGGSAQITGDFSLDEAKTLVVQLNAGALPVSISLIEQRTVGATLGADSVAKSIRAGLVGLFMVLLFMILYYGKLGIFADLALIIFGILTLALYKIIPVVLTLPGIAGFLLTVGMAVDSNILIFERFKEEKGKRPIHDALEVSFGRAWDSIRDANIATLVTAFILANPLDWSFLHTSGPVRGFAITLALGVLLSMFTGIVVSRNLLRVFVKEKKIK